MPPHNSATIRAMAVARDEVTSSLFVGREDGSIEKYTSADDADLGKPSLVLLGHRGPITGLAVVSVDEVYSCSLDGSITQWNAAVDPGAVEGGHRVLRSLSGAVALHGLTLHPGSGRLYAGGDDGALHVVDGERRSTWPGLAQPITCVTHTPDGALILTGDAKGSVLAWDPQEGRALCELRGHTAAITGITYVEPAEDAEGGAEDEGEAERDSGADGPQISPTAGAIVTFAKDDTVRVWAVPDPTQQPVMGDDPDHGDDDAGRLADAGEEGGGEAGEGGEGGERRSRRSTPVAMVSFQVPTPADGGEAQDGAGPGEHAESEAYRRKRVSFEAAPVLTIAPPEADSATPAAAEPVDGEVAGAAAAAHDSIADILHAPITVKSALKAPERLRLPVEVPLGTIELPATPHGVYQPPVDEEAEVGEGGGAGAALVYVGSVAGTVWGLKLEAMARTVLRFVADNRRRVRRELRVTERLLRKSEARLRQECRAAVKRETDTRVRAAEKAYRAKRDAERKKLREERLAAARAAAEARRAAAAELGDDEEMEEMEEMEEAEEVEEEEEAEEVESDDAHGEEGGLDAADAADGAFFADDSAAERRLRERELRRLSPEQRTALDAFVAEKEKARDVQLREIKEAVEAHLAKVRPLAKATYDRPRADFARLKFTAYASVAPSAAPKTVGGSVRGVTAAALRRPPTGPDGEAVLALVESGGRVYASQAGHVAITRVTPGMVRL